MKYIAFDTSSPYLLVAAAGERKVYKALLAPRTQQEEIFPFLERALVEASLKPEDIELIAAGVGPGSYTSLRVGVTAARTMAQALDVPVLALDSLRLCVYAAVRSGYAAKEISVARRLRKGEYYAAVYRINDQIVTMQAPQIVKAEKLLDFKNRVCFSGDADEGLAREIVPDGSELIYAVEEALKQQKPTDWRKLLPVYLRKSYAEEKD